MQKKQMVPETMCGFLKQSCRVLPELNARLYEMKHIKSGARLIWLDREDQNKTFGIAFPTLPEDDTGVFHILEHSVLCGSERYPVKDPFVALMKGSLKTFLNAMTFPDKTFYPVSSRNGKDFLNLIRVYMDAVLHPLIYQRPEIFEQEGWHYAFSQDSKQLSYQGVVLNEMKGAFSSPDTLMKNELNRQLFPDCEYRYVYGGDPAHIPDLTYEQFLECHRRCYHPSHAFIFLDGQMEINQVLSVLDQEYLSGYYDCSTPPVIPVQPPVKRDPVRIYYEIAPDEPVQDNGRLAFGYVLGDYTCRQEVTAVRVLGDVLCGSNESPLKKRILSAGLAKDVRIRVFSGIQQPYAVLELVCMDQSRQDEIRSIVTDEISRLVRDGLDHDQLAATVANLEFSMRERDFGQMPQGLGLGLTVLESWIYGGDPASGLEVGGLFDILNQNLKTGYFEALLAQVFLNNPHTCEVLLVPSTTLGKEKREQEEMRLHKEQRAWSDRKQTALQKKQNRLLAWQSTPDSSEMLASLPRLCLPDLPVQPEEISLEVEEVQGLSVIYHDLPTGGVDYVNLYFDISDLRQDQISDLSLLCILLGNLGTERYTAAELQRLEKLYLGDIRFALETYSSENQPGICRTFLCASFSTLEGKLEPAVDLVAEILTKTRMGNLQKIRQLLQQIITKKEQEISANGSAFAVTRVSAGSSSEGVIRECSGGITWYQWIKALDQDFAFRGGQLETELKALYNHFLTTGRLTVSVTGQNKNAARILCNILLERLPFTYKANYDCGIVPWEVRREGIIIPADVTFTAMGGNLLPCGCMYSGITPLIGRVMSLGYLWETIRVQGGAYGTGFLLEDAGGACFYSFRDPNAAHSIDCYRRSATFVQQLPERITDLTDYIIGTVAAIEPPLMAKQKGKLADSWYWQGISYEKRCQHWSELLSATPERLANMADPIRKLTKTAGICVIGSSRQIKVCADELTDVFSL